MQQPATNIATDDEVIDILADALWLGIIAPGKALRYETKKRKKRVAKKKQNAQVSDTTKVA